VVKEKEVEANTQTRTNEIKIIEKESWCHIEIRGESDLDGRLEPHGTGD
jgi:hypothetical protein